jgi:hypothetical protein
MMHRNCTIIIILATSTIQNKTFDGNEMPQVIPRSSSLTLKIFYKIWKPVAPSLGYTTLDRRAEVPGWKVICSFMCLLFIHTVQAICMSFAVSISQSFLKFVIPCYLWSHDTLLPPWPFQFLPLFNYITYLTYLPVFQYLFLCFVYPCVCSANVLKIIFLLLLSLHMPHYRALPLI